jgi:hypothetical protein
MAWQLNDYVDVPHRLKMLADKFPDVRIVESEPVVRVVADRTFIEVKVTAWRSPDDQHPAVAYCWEPFPGDTPYTRDSEQMNAATSALGRLVAVMLPGAFAKLASTNEVFHRAGPPQNYVPKAKGPVPVVGGGPDPFDGVPSHKEQLEAIVERERNEKKAASAGSPITQPQMKMLGATAKRKGLTVAEDVRQFCADVIGRDITSARDLTKGEASKVIDRLTELPDHVKSA